MPASPARESLRVAEVLTEVLQEVLRRLKSERPAWVSALPSAALGFVVALLLASVMLQGANEMTPSSSQYSSPQQLQARMKAILTDLEAQREEAKEAQANLRKQLADAEAASAATQAQSAEKLSQAEDRAKAWQEEAKQALEKLRNCSCQKSPSTTKGGVQERENPGGAAGAAAADNMGNRESSPVGETLPKGSKESNPETPSPLTQAMEKMRPLKDWPGAAQLLDLSFLSPGQAGPKPNTSLFYINEAWPDRCAGVAHKRYSLRCAMAEAKALGRILAVHKTMCISTDHTELKKELWTATASYFDLGKMAEEHGLPVVYMEDLVTAMLQAENQSRAEGKNQVFSVLVYNETTPYMELMPDRSTDIIMRHVRPWMCGFEVCNHDSNKDLWGFYTRQVPFNRHVEEVGDRIVEALGGEGAYTAVHIRRGDKAKRKDRWPHLDADTSPESLKQKLPALVPPGSNIYIATDEDRLDFFDPLKETYNVSRLTDFVRFWARGSQWHNDFKHVLGVPDPKWDVYHEGIVDDYIMGKGGKRIETFNDLTQDPRNGIPRRMK